MKLEHIFETLHERFMPRMDYKIPADECSCSGCGWEGKVEDCDTEWESDGWEYPEYRIHLCPNNCEYGVIDDYWYSDHEWEFSQIVEVIQKGGINTDSTDNISKYIAHR